MPWVMSPKVAEVFRIGRVLLVGDAASRLSPAGGLGLNTGVQAAHNLAWKLAKVIERKAGPAILDTYQEERRGAALWTMQNTNRNSEEIFEIVAKALENDWEAVRNLIAGSRRIGSGLGQDLGISYASGAFVADNSELAVVKDPINDYQPAARPGSRAPHLWIDRHGAKLSTLDLFGGKMVLLAGAAYPSIRLNPEEVIVFQNGKDFVAHEFERLYGIAENGAVLVRPDGYVGARWKEVEQNFPDQFASALAAILRAS